MVELLKVFDEDYRYIHNEYREKIHESGLWHETFHCWLVDEENVYIQKRSFVKKDFPGMYDITAAGHLLADETVMDGVREVEEEIGIVIDHMKLQSTGVVRDTIKLPGFIDNEFANVFVYKYTFAPTDFKLQQEEVDGIHIVEIQDLVMLFRSRVVKVVCKNIHTGEVGELKLTDFVPHETEYFIAIADMLNNIAP
ncbi:NUDIX domain-containing protein [Sporosarcina sp. FSL W8-0480]|uniref:NUDIX hydrolase n=1 Tax=Sporosarcina sp. FSL W8-0480 TaxID=2954701 RepID=UPI0030D6F94F